MAVVVKSRTTETLPSAFGEPAYMYLVDGLNVNEPTNHRVTVPLRAFQERRERELVPPCAACIAENRLMHVPLEEKAEGGVAAHRYRPMHRHDPATCSGEDCFAVSSCTCAECDCCIEALKIVLEECLVAQQPDYAHKLPDEKKKRYAAIGVLQNHVWDEETKTLIAKADLPSEQGNLKAFDLRVEV